MANLSPNRFVLQSRDGKTKVDYETTTFVGQPFLNLTQGPGPLRHFAGSQIRTLNTRCPPRSTSRIVSMQSPR